MVDYHALVPGGYCSSDPYNKAVPVSVRNNNPGAINGAGWERSFPGYVMEIETTPGNHTTVFEAPEYGVAAWWELLNRYNKAGAITVHQIITRYGGGQNYTEYEQHVAQITGYGPNTAIDLANNTQLARFGRAMFQHEAGKVNPITDAQIIYGLNLGRSIASDGPPPIVAETHTANPSGGGFLSALARLLASWFGGTKPAKLVYTQPLREGAVGSAIEQLQRRLHELGYDDIVADGEFGELTKAAVQDFQNRHNIDPNGEVDQLTIAALNSTAASQAKPPLLPPSEAKYGAPPKWYQIAVKDIGFHETGNNQGIEFYITAAKTGHLGDSWCAIGVNSGLERSGVKGSRSAAARSFERSPDFVKLEQPALGCIVTMWRGSPSSGLGHVFFYDGENSTGVRGIGYNEDDQVKRSFHDRSRIVGYYWPKAVPLPALGPIKVSGLADVAGSET